MHKNDLVRLHHMLDAAQEALRFIEGRQRDSLDADRMLSLSLVQLLEIIGEAARGVSSSFREAHPEVPWRKMVGMRDRLIHGYFDVNLDIVWGTVTEDLPRLIAALEKIIPEQDD